MSRLALKAAADAGRQLAQPGHPWDNTTSLDRPQIIVYGDLTTHTTIDAVEELATHILGQVVARRAKVRSCQLAGLCLLSPRAAAGTAGPAVRLRGQWYWQTECTCT